MSKPLPGVGALLSDSWRQFTATWNESLKVSVWFLYVGLGQFVLGLVQKLAPETSAFMLPLYIALFLVMLWASIRLIQAVLQIEEGKKPALTKEASRSAVNLILPVLWVGILQALILVAGFVLLVIPGIYLAIALTFSQIILVSQGTRGIAALQASRELVKGRWWPTFGRLLAGGIVFGLGIAVITSVVMAVLIMVAGPEPFAQLETENADPLLNGALSLFQSIIQAAFVPLVLLYQIKVFRALQKSK